MCDLTTAQAAYDAAHGAYAAAYRDLCDATGRHVAARLGHGWRVGGGIEGASATRHRQPGRGLGYPVEVRWTYGDGDRAWSAWAAHEGRDSDRCGAPDPVTEAAYGATPAGALLALAGLADGMAARGRLPRRVADLRHLAQYCRELAAECPEVADGA